MGSYNFIEKRGVSAIAFFSACFMTQPGENALKPLRVLVVEDSEDDTNLVIRQIRKGGYEPVFERVETAKELKNALATRLWDVIISDISMPSFNGITALKITQESGLDLPFILVSGTIAEETAVSAMKAGAHDFLTKFNLSRLIPAIEREMRESQTRREHRRIEADLEAYHAGLEKRVGERTAELKSANEKLSKSKQLSDALNRIGEVIHSRLEFSEIMNQVVTEAALAIEVDAASIGLLHEDRFTLRYVYNLPSSLVHASFPLDSVRGVTYAIANQDVVAFSDAANDRRVNTSFWSEYGIRSLMAVPLMAKKEMIGAINFYTIERHFEFDAVHLDFGRKLSN